MCQRITIKYFILFWIYLSYIMQEMTLNNWKFNMRLMQPMLSVSKGDSSLCLVGIEEAWKECLEFLGGLVAGVCISEMLKAWYIWSIMWLLRFICNPTQLIYPSPSGLVDTHTHAPQFAFMVTPHKYSATWHRMNIFDSDCANLSFMTGSLTLTGLITNLTQTRQGHWTGLASHGLAQQEL